MKNIAQIVNKGTKIIELDSYTSTLIISKEKLNNIKDIDLWIINIHLNWEGNYLQNNYGLDIAVYIRKNLKSKSPILFYSHITETNFNKLIKKSDFKYKLLETPQIYYIKAPINEASLVEKIKSTAPISDLCLDDINYYIFDAKGRIDELCHDLRNDLKNVSANKNNLLEVFKNNCINEIEPINIIKFDNLFEEFKSNVIKKNQYDELINNVKTAIYLLLPKSDDDDIEPNKEPVNWQVIYLEDDKHIADEIKAGFKENLVTCHIASNGEEVIKLLEANEDVKNEDVINVSLFITDIRLKDKNGNWQNHQGYDVIEQVANRSKKPLVFAVLTSKKGSIINSAKQNLKYKIHWENKENVIHNKQAFNVYFNRLKELGEENFVSNECFNPVLDSWKSYDLPNRIAKDKNGKEITKKDKNGKDVYQIKQVRKVQSFETFYRKYKTQSFDFYCKKEEELNKLDYEDIQYAKNVEFNFTLTNADDISAFADKFLKARRFLLYHIFKNSKLINELDAKNKVNKIALSNKYDRLKENIILFYIGLKHNTEILIEEYNFLYEKGLIKEAYEKYNQNTINDLIDKNQITDDDTNHKRNTEASRINQKIISSYGGGEGFLKNNEIKKEYNSMYGKKTDEFDYLKKFVGILKNKNIKLSNFYSNAIFDEDIKKIMVPLSTPSPK